MGRTGSSVSLFLPRMTIPTGRLLVMTFGLLLIFTACASIGPPLPPSLELPKPISDLSARRKGDHVILRWTFPTVTTDRQIARSLGPTRICRGLEPDLSQCGTPVGEAPPPDRAMLSKSSGQKIQGTYTDLLSEDLERNHPLDFATYAVEVLNGAGRSAGLSNQVKVPLVETLPPPKDFAAQVSDKGVVLTWKGSPFSLTAADPVHHFYRAYRREEGSQQTTLVGQLRVGVDAHLALADQSFEWEKTYYYHASTLAVIAHPGKAEVQIEGDDTPEVKVFTHDVFPPAVPAGLQAVFSGPGQPPAIDLVWAPVTDMDLAGYNAYRREEGGIAVKLNPEPVRTPAYRDTNVASGKKYLYSVSAVDVRGNESARSDEAGESVP
jgi:hypothetical protein